MIRQRLPYLVIILCLLWTVAVGRGASFKISGKLVGVNSSGEESPWSDFEIIVSGDKFRIANHYFNGEVLLNGSDGTNSFYLNKMATVSTNDSRHWEWGSVSAGRYPLKDLTAGQLCWLAFACVPGEDRNKPLSFPIEALQQNAADMSCVLTRLASAPA